MRDGGVGGVVPFCESDGVTVGQVATGSGISNHESRELESTYTEITPAGVSPFMRRFQAS